MRFLPFLVLAAACSSEPAAVVPGQAVAAAPKVTELSVQELKAAQQAGDVAVLIDVRTPGEFAEGHVPGAKNIPLDQLMARKGEIDATGPVHLVCRSGSRSARAASMLSLDGVEAVNVAGGTLAWQRAGFAVE